MPSWDRPRGHDLILEAFYQPDGGFRVRAFIPPDPRDDAKIYDAMLAGEVADCAVVKDVDPMVANWFRELNANEFARRQAAWEARTATKQ